MKISCIANRLVRFPVNGLLIMNSFVPLLVFALLFNVEPITRGDCVAPPSGMVGWWPGDGNANDIQDGNNGMLGNASFATGKVEQGFKFSCEEQGVVIPHNNTLNVNSPGFTADFWMQGMKNQPGSVAAVFEKSHGFVDNTGWAFQVETTTGAPRFAIGNGSGFAEIMGGVDVLDGNFHHVAGTWDGSTMWLYVDGVLHGSAASSSAANNTRDLNIGFAWGAGTPQRFFRGIADELEVFNRALSEQEILGIYNAGSAGKCKPTPSPTPTPSPCIAPPSGMVGWWPGDGNANDIQDGNNGMLGNASFATGKVEQGFKFSCEEQGVVIPHNNTLNVNSPGFTADFWMQGMKNQPGSVAAVFEKSHGFVDNTGWAFQVETTTGAPRFAIGNGSGFAEIMGGVDVLDGNFHHVAGTWDGSTMWLYVDGVLHGSAASSSAANNTRDLNIGFAWGAGTPQRFFRGIADELEVFNRALSEQENPRDLQRRQCGQMQTYTISDSHAYTHTKSHANSHTHTHANTNAHAHANANANPDTSVPCAGTTADQC